MFSFLQRRIALVIVALCYSVALASSARAGSHEFRIKFPDTVRSAPFTGRVYLFFTKGKNQEPRMGPNWFNPEPMLALDVENWKPNEPLAVGAATGDRLIATPKPLAELDLKGYQVQAVARFNPYERVVGNGPGNGYSAVAEVAETTTAEAPQELTIDKHVAENPFPENRWYKLLSVHSKLLSDFHQREVALRGSILLPASYYDQPERRYPVIIEVPGFGGTHVGRRSTEPIAEKNEGGVEFIRITLDPSCPLGHHVFADSANNGPVGQALVSEWIPELDRTYRTVSASTARFVTGHSSGGWSSLWLQVAYPDVFGGTWSTAPDPVDFRNFQRIDMYRTGENMYRDAAGARRPLARMGEKVVLWYDDFDHTEEALGFGGQLHSFEAVFSPRGADGKPRRAWNRNTGAVDTEVAQAWEKYDIRLVLERNWSELGPKLAGKLHVFQGDLDTFYLDGATRLLKASLAKLNSDAVVEMVPEKTHFNLITPELAQRIRSEMVATYLKHHGAK
ncbi:MAG: enterochelin esterase [Planctomycetes bacterium]|nr:enterochelin esterase [Planctomycetota bacterium]